MSMRAWLGGVLALGVLTLACDRERRDFQPDPAAAAAPARGARGAINHVGSDDPSQFDENAQQYPGIGGDAQRRAYAISEGKRLFDAYNCGGCHGNGGGGIGPPLMDRSWRYRGDIGNIYTTIVDGRPNGMPSFSGRIPQYQV